MNKQESVAVFGYDTKIIFWNIKDGAILHVFKENNCELEALALTSDSKYIISAEDDFGVKVWDVSLIAKKEICKDIQIQLFQL